MFLERKIFPFPSWKDFRCNFLISDLYTNEEYLFRLKNSNSVRAEIVKKKVSTLIRPFPGLI